MGKTCGRGGKVMILAVIPARGGSKVIDSRPAEDNNCIRRRRQCDICGKRFNGYRPLMA